MDIHSFSTLKTQMLMLSACTQVQVSLQFSLRDFSKAWSFILCREIIGTRYLKGISVGILLKEEFSVLWRLDLLNLGHDLVQNQVMLNQFKIQIFMCLALNIFETEWGQLICACWFCIGQVYESYLCMLVTF